jgi:hypothetical protein
MTLVEIVHLNEYWYTLINPHATRFGSAREPWTTETGKELLTLFENNHQQDYTRTKDRRQSSQVPATRVGQPKPPPSRFLAVVPAGRQFVLIIPVYVGSFHLDLQQGPRFARQISGI